MSVTPKTANGWGSVFNGGITGGTGGTEISFNNFPAMWEWMNANKTTSAIVTYTGSDFTRLGFPITTPNTTFSNSARFEISGLKNKTIRGSLGQLLTLTNVRFLTNENIVWENWRFFDSLDDLVSILTDSINIWIRHCELDGNQADAVSPNYTGTVDGGTDVTGRSNYISITDCTLKNLDRTLLIGAADTSILDRDKLKVTIARCKFFQCIQRKPRVRFGQVGVQHCIFDYGNQFNYTSGKAIDIGIEAQIWAYQNKFVKEYRPFSDRNQNGGLKSSLNRFLDTNSVGTSEVRPELVEWDILTEENYTIDTWTDSEMDAWVDQWAGATMHLMALEPEDEFSLTITSTTGGTVSQSPLGTSFTAGTSITLTATASEGFVFSRYRNPSTNETLSTNAVYTFSKSASAQSIQAVFVSSTPPSNGKKFIARKKP
jgi:pectate lyase